MLGITQGKSILASSLGLSAFAEGLAVVIDGGEAQLLFAAPGNTAGHVSLGPATVGVSVSGDPLDDAPGVGFDQVETPQGTLLFTFADRTADASVALLSAKGVSAAAQTLVTTAGTPLGRVGEMAALDTAGLVAVNRWNAGGFEILRLGADGRLAPLASIPDTPKAMLADVSDAVVLTQADGEKYLLSLSAVENGITSTRIDASGSAEIIDTLGAHDGLWVNGPQALTILNVGGQDFAVVASTGSNSLSTVRVNEMGCLFTADHLIDSTTTRFAHASALDDFVAQGRSFVLVAGDDGGVTLLEVLPGGTLDVMQSIPMEKGEGLMAVKALEVAVVGDRAWVFMTDARADRILRLDIDLSSLGPLLSATGGSLSGTNRDDRIIGSDLADTLIGGGGDDRLHDGAGVDLLLGQGGADVFHLSRDGSSDRIGDFEKGFDRLDVSDWGRIYSVSALDIRSTPTGAEIHYGNETLIIDSADGTSLAASSFSDADFLF